MGVQAFHAPTSLEDAVALLGSAPDGASVLGGGTDLLVQMRAGSRNPSAIVDLKRIPGLQGIGFDGARLRIGAATRCAEVAVHPAIRRHWPGLAEAAGLIGSKQVQGRASLGGNLCNASPAADSVPALVANRAVAVVAGPAGERRLAVECVTLGPGRTVLAPGEFVVAFELESPAKGTADAYLRFIPRTEMDIAVVGAAASLTLDASGVCRAVRLAFGAVAPTVLTVPEAEQALLGRPLDDAALADCAEAVRAAVRPISDRRGTAEFRRHVAGVLVRRVLTEAARRAAGAA